MVLSRDATGSQRFQSDGGYRTGDIRALTQPPTIEPSSEIVPGADYSPPVPIKGMPGLYRARATLHHAGGPIRQRGDFVHAHASRSSGSLQCDTTDVMRLPNIVDTQATPDISDETHRMMHVNYLGTNVIGGYRLSGATQLVRDTSTADPTLVAVAGYPSGTMPQQLTCLRTARFASTEYLLAGFFNENGATSHLQAITNITTNPPTVAYIPTPANVAAIYDVLQLPDGSIMVMHTNSISMISSTDSAGAPAAATIGANQAAMPGGGYFVGLQSLGGGRPLVYAVVSDQGTTMMFNPLSPATHRGQLKGISLDGWTVSDVDMGLPWITFATSVRDGIMACDQHTHVFNTGRRVQTMRWLEDRAATSEGQILCRGHYTDGVRVWWKANYVPSTGSTVSWWEEYNFDRNVSLPVSGQLTYATAGTQTVGGWNLPYFADTRRIVDYADGSWHRQKQPPISVLGYNQVHTAGAAAGTGDDFEPLDQNSWPVMWFPGFEGCPMVCVSIEGPTNGSISHGMSAVGAGTTDAWVECRELLSGVGARFHRRGPTERRPKRLFPLNRSWSHGFQPQVIMQRQVGGTDAAKYTPGGLPVTYEFILYRDGAGNVLPAQYKSIDATRLLRAG
jgi:hypothetical protein